MTNEQLSASLSYLGDELLAECGARRQRPKRSWRTALIKAACIALVLFSGIYVAGRFDYSLGAGCASSPGTIADGRYYYHVRHSGVWCYDPAMGTSERVLSTFWYDGYAVNGYGIYYLRGETLYVQVHETGERIKLYTAPQDCTRLFFSLLGDGRIDVQLRFNSYTIHQDKVPTDTEPNVPSWSYNDTIVWSEYLLDGRTGELLEVRQEYASSGAGFEQFYENTHLTFGGYEFTLVPSGQRADGVALYRLLRDGEDVTLCLTNVDLELFMEHYNVFNMEYHSGWKFKSTIGLFKDYIDKWNKVKMESTLNGNKAMRTLAKLMLNALYGKFALNPGVQSKLPWYDNGVIKYKLGEKETREPIYIPVGTFITAWARYKTISSAQKVYDRFVYADTDSLHLVGTEIPDMLEIDPVKLGAWKHESTFTRARFIRQKSYIEEIDGVLNITCAGMPDRCYQYVTWDNFHTGATYAGKLGMAHVNGGIVLKDIPFSIKY